MTSPDLHWFMDVKF